MTHRAEIRIGWFGPTNLNDPLTGDLWWAANCALQEANRQAPPAVGTGAASPPLRLVPRWAVDPWGTGVSQLARMVYEEQPLALLGSVDSASTHLAEQVVAKANLPLVSPIATDNSVNLAGVPWMFSCAPSDAAVARALAGALLTELGDSRRKCVLLAATDHESRMTSRELLAELRRRGRLPDFRFDVPPGAADIDRQMQAAVEARPDAVVVIAGPEPAARLTRAVREKLGQAIVFGSHTLGRRSFRECAGPAAEGVRFPLLWTPPDATDTNAARFVQRFAAERGHEPDYAAALAYDATRLLIEAIRRAGPNRARVREALAELSPWRGVAGPIRFDGAGQNTRKDLPMAAIKRGALVPLSPTKDLAQTASNNPPR